MALENNINLDTIVALASGLGRSGIGVIRISGSRSLAIAKNLIHKVPTPRQAHYSVFKNNDNQILDKGLLLYFPAPNSFTGEDVLECQVHGSPVIIQLLIQHIVSMGARLARPGEFSERAFLNNKIDLVQAEAIADLINADTEKAAMAAVQSLEGVFSEKINTLNQEIIYLRSYIEAAIDFPEEEIDFLSDGKIKNHLINIIDSLTTILHQAKQGVLLQSGMTVVIAGLPNAGKSSLLNQLSQRDSAIVTHIPGTTRDILRENINIDGMPLQIIDTAGLRETEDIIEQEGIKRAKSAIEKADTLLYITDVNSPDQHYLEYDQQKLILIYNKIDLSKIQPHIDNNRIYLSAKTGNGIELLKDYLKHQAGLEDNTENIFSARTRHLEALKKALDYLTQGLEKLTHHQNGECAAEDLRLAHISLGEIIGEFTTEDLLGNIFASFCVGK
jgi:tRNA modification GTPase